MPQYQYTSSDENGELRLGFIEAGSEESARDLLAKQGIVAGSVELTTSNEVAPESPASDDSVWMTTDEHVEVVGQIGHLVSAGLPLAAGLRTLSEEVPSRRLRKVFDRLSAGLDRGETLEDVLKSESRDLPDWLAAVFEAGTKSGRLPECIALHRVQPTASRHQSQTHYQHGLSRNPAGRRNGCLRLYMQSCDSRFSSDL